MSCEPYPLVGEVDLAVAPVADYGVPIADYSPEGWFGAAVTAGYDHDGDGYGDAAVGAPVQENLAGAYGAGAAYVFTERPCGSIPRSAAALVVYGLHGGDELSGDLTHGDLDGDGVEDLVIGAFTSPGTLVVAHDGTLGTYDADTVGTLVTGLGLGAFPNFVGDINGDGFADVLPGEDPPSGERVIAGPLAHGVVDMTRDYAAALPRGISALVGDLDGDGIDDVSQGSTVFFGPLAGTYEEGDEDLVLGFADDEIGAGVKGTAQDVDGDGREDVVALVSLPTPGEFRVAVIAGDRWSMSSSAALGSVVDLDEVLEISESAGDLNADGVPELLLARSPTSAADPVRGWLFYGPLGGTQTVEDAGATLVHSVPDGVYDAPIADIARAGDLNGDGFDDLVIGHYATSNEYIGDLGLTGGAWVLLGGPW